MGTRRIYAGALRKFQASVGKPLARLTVSDLLHYKEKLLSGSGRKPLAAATVNRVLLGVLYTCGGRRAEAAGLRWCDLQPRSEDGQVTVFGKGGKSRAVLVLPALWDELLARRGHLRRARLCQPQKRTGWCRADVQGWVRRPLDLSMINLIVARAALAAGLGNKAFPHWVRHTHASQALDNGTPRHMLQAMLGHSSLTTTSRQAR